MSVAQAHGLWCHFMLPLVKLTADLHVELSFILLNSYAPQHIFVRLRHNPEMSVSNGSEG